MDVSSPLFSSCTTDVSYPLFSSCPHSSLSSPSCDSELYNISSPEAVTPPPCVDFCLNDLSFPIPGAPCSTPLRGAKSTSSPSSCEESGSGGGGRRRSRSRSVSKQRQSASEKEKLRMRDLTKALHHLRTYLPPSVAPTGQTLTKIETLRLAIRYISSLSAQLRRGEEPLCHRKELRSPAALTGLSHYGMAPESWRGPVFPTFPDPPLSALGAQCHFSGMADALPGGTDLELPGCGQLLSSSLRPLLEEQLCPDTSLSYQDYSRDMQIGNTSAGFCM